MEVRAVSKYVKIQPRKVRIIADEVRGMPVVFAAHKLRYHTSKGATELRKTLLSAAANAAENHELPIESLKISEIRIDEGPRQKRMIARAMGRGNRILKKTAHILVVVSDVEAAETVKAHGTRPKARPTLAVKPGKAPRTPRVAAAPKVAASISEEPVEAQVEDQVEAPGSTDPVNAEPVVASPDVAEEAVAPAEPTVNEAARADENGEPYPGSQDNAPETDPNATEAGPSQADAQS